VKRANRSGINIGFNNQAEISLVEEVEPFSDSLLIKDDLNIDLTKTDENERKETSALKGRQLLAEENVNESELSHTELYRSTYGKNIITE